MSPPSGSTKELTRADIIQKADAFLMPNYARFPIALVRGEGSWVWDADGKKYLDFVGGIAVMSLGHAPEGFADVVKQQAATLAHVSNLYYTAPQAELAEELVKASFPSKVFFCNSGTEANEAAIKLARKYGKETHGDEKYEIVALFNSFHGRTFGSLSATGQVKYHKGFEPLVPGFFHVPFNDLVALEAILGMRTAAVMMEPVQAEGGVVMPSEDYLRKVREMCTKKKTLLIFDEVQVGLGRTGKLFAYQQFGVEPDILTLGKSLGGGLPMAAMLAKTELASALGPGSHAVTMGGSPLVAQAGLWAFRKLMENGFLEKSRQMGAYLREKLEGLRAIPPVQDVRGIGMIQAVELNVPARPVAAMCLEEGLLVTVVQDRVVRLVPPLNVKRAEVDRAIKILEEAIRQAEKERGSAPA
ncbi:MAG: aspartate aminotransferase family protein [Nitrospirae bacterium]|nr:aspartate aminotransferase family protein [Nitrospirota bacterium]